MAAADVSSGIGAADCSEHRQAAEATSTKRLFLSES
jgi:hypothetical protein